MTNPTSKNEVYRNLAKAAVEQNPASLQKAIDSIPNDFIDSDQNAINPIEWRQLVNDVYSKKRATRQIITVVAVLAAVMIIGIGGLFFLKKLLGGKQPQASTEVTTAPIATTVNTEAPTATLEPTLTPTQTLLPDSSYYLTDATTITPGAPASGQGYWVMPGMSATTNPPEDPSVWVLSPMPYIAQKDASIKWVIDKPLNVDGIFAIYYIDSVAGTLGPQHFTVSDQKGEVKPLAGSGDITLAAKADQKEDQWRLIGYYPLSVGQVVSVEVINPQGSYIAANNILLVKLADSDQKILASIPGGKVPVLFADDQGSATYSGKAQADGTGSFTASSDGWQTIKQTDAWMGSFAELPAGWTTLVRVKYPEMVLPAAGKYELFVYIPSGVGAEVTYNVKLDDYPIDAENPAKVNQSTSAGKWVSVGTWDFTKAGKITVSIDADAQGTSPLGADAIAFVYVGEINQ